MGWQQVPLEQAWTFYQKGQLDSAEHYLNVLDLSLLNNNDKVSYLELSAEIKLKEQTAESRLEAIESLIQALEITRALNEEQLQEAQLNDRIGDIYDMMRQRVLTHVYYNEAYIIREKIRGSEDSRAISYLNMAKANYRMGYDSLLVALGFARQAMANTENQTKAFVYEANYWMGAILNVIVDLPDFSKVYLDSALKYSNYALSLAEELQDTTKIIVSSNLQSFIKINSGKPQEALEILNKVEVILKDLEDRNKTPSEEYYATTFGNLSQAYTALGNYGQALKYSNLRYNYVVGMIMQAERTRVAQITEDYRTDKQLDQAEETAFFASRRASYLGVGLVVLLVVLLISYLIFIQTLQRKKLENLKAMVMGEEQERKRVAKDLHDGIGVLLTSVKLRLSAFEDSVEDKKAYKESLSQIDNACTEVRRISHNMVPASLTKLGLAEATMDLLDNVKASTQLRIEEIIDVEEGILNEKREVLVYRIIQELINNSIKYAQASTLHLTMKMDDSHLSILYKDDGKGFERNEVNEGLGLKSIASRIDILKGKLLIQSSSGKGSQFTINIPVHGED